MPAKTLLNITLIMLISLLACSFWCYWQLIFALNPYSEGFNPCLERFYAFGMMKNIYLGIGIIYTLVQIFCCTVVVKIFNRSHKEVLNSHDEIEQDWLRKFYSIWIKLLFKSGFFYLSIGLLLGLLTYPILYVNQSTVVIIWTLIEVIAIACSGVFIMKKYLDKINNIPEEIEKVELWENIMKEKIPLDIKCKILISLRLTWMPVLILTLGVGGLGDGVGLIFAPFFGISIAFNIFRSLSNWESRIDEGIIQIKDWTIVISRIVWLISITISISSVFYLISKSLSNGSNWKIIGSIIPFVIFPSALPVIGLMSKAVDYFLNDVQKIAINNTVLNDNNHENIHKTKQERNFEEIKSASNDSSRDTLPVQNSESPQEITSDEPSAEEKPLTKVRRRP